MQSRRTFGSAFDESRDGSRLRHQLDRIRNFTLAESNWRTLSEIGEALGYPEWSISAQLRHLRKPKFGRYVVEKRLRNGRGTWESSIRPPESPTTLGLFDGLKERAAEPAQKPARIETSQFPSFERSFPPEPSASERNDSGQPGGAS